MKDSARKKLEASIKEFAFLLETAGKPQDEESRWILGLLRDALAEDLHALTKADTPLVAIGCRCKGRLH